jgi:hypothetical protein
MPGCPWSEFASDVAGERTTVSQGLVIARRQWSRCIIRIVIFNQGFLCESRMCLALACLSNVVGLGAHGWMAQREPQPELQPGHMQQQAKISVENPEYKSL